MSSSTSSRFSRRPGREVVEHAHAVPVRQQAVDDVRADEAAPAGDQDLHGLQRTSASTQARTYVQAENASGLDDRLRGLDIRSKVCSGRGSGHSCRPRCNAGCVDCGNPPCRERSVLSCSRRPSSPPCSERSRLPLRPTPARATRPGCGRARRPIPQGRKAHARKRASAADAPGPRRRRHPNGRDRNVDGDRKRNVVDPDVDGDGRRNDYDHDIDARRRRQRLRRRQRRLRRPARGDRRDGPGAARLRRAHLGRRLLGHGRRPQPPAHHGGDRRHRGARPARRRSTGR